MNDQELLNQILKAKSDFGVKCPKYSGSVSAEVVRDGLREHNIVTSNRDAFINGVPIEIDLLIARPGVMPMHGLLYQPGDVLAALEIKETGSFGEATIERTKTCFSMIKASNREIYCAYVTVAERRNFRWAVSEDKLGSPVYTLFWHTGGKHKHYEPTGHWLKLVNALTSQLHNSIRPPALGTRTSLPPSIEAATNP